MVSFSGLYLSFFNDLFVENSDENHNKNFTNIETPEIAMDEMDGKPLLVHQYANITKSYQGNVLPMSIDFDLVPDWTSKNVTIDYHNVSKKKDWISNGDLSSDMTGWTFKSLGSEWSLNGYSSFTGNPAGSLKYRFSGVASEGDYAYFEQNITIPEEFASGNAKLSMDYQITWTDIFNGSIFISLIVDNVEKNKTVNMMSVPLQEWESLIFTYDPTVYGQILPNTATLRVGTKVLVDTTIAPWNEIYFDNIKCELWTKPNNSGIVKIKDNEFNQNYTYISTDFGEGYSFIDIERYTEVSKKVTFTIYQNISDVIDFKIENIIINSYGEKSFFSEFLGNPISKIEFASSIKWYTDISITSIPIEYASWLEVEKPNDWSFSKITDGYETEQLSSCSGTDFGYNILKIPYSILSSGLWKLEAISKNYISNANLQSWNGTEYSSKSSFTNGDTFEVDLTLNDSVFLPNTSINCTIFYPNSSIFWQDNKEPTAYNEKFGNFTVGNNMSIGEYRVEIIWTNNQTALNIDQIGYIVLNFDLWHHTNLSAIDDYFELIAGDPLLIKLSFLDTDINKHIAFAEITYSSSYGLSGAMVYQGLGTYFVDLDTSSLGLGLYSFSFNASKSFYENHSNIELIQVMIVAQPLALDFPKRIINSTGNNYAICRVNVLGEISGMPIWPVNISSDWNQNYSIFNHDNGTYTFNFSTYGLPIDGVLDTFEIEIFVNKSNYGSTSDFITLIIHPIPTSAKANSTNIETHINEYFEIKVNYTNEKTKALINGGECAVSWDSNYNISQVSDGFIIRYYTLGLSISVHSSVITLSKPGYEDALESITVIIHTQDVNLTVRINGDEVIQNSVIDVYFKEVLNISSRAFANRESKFLTGGSITLLSENYQTILTELTPTFFSCIIIMDGLYFNPGLNTIYLRFEQLNYTTETISFQFFIRAQNVNLNISINNQNIEVNSLIEVSYNDIFSISCRAFAETEGIYLSGGIVKFIVDIHEINLTESINYWYNESIGIATDLFSLGINYVYIKFELSNYTTTTFSFQVLVNQIEINVRTLDFEDSINVYSGETLTIWINLTESGSNKAIENATIYCYWEFGTYNFEHSSEGLYKMDLILPGSILGTHRFNLIISTGGSIYKTTEHSFLIIITERAIPDYVFWIIVISLFLIIGLLGSLSLRSYVILPKRRRRELIIADKTQPYKDIRNIQAILVSNRYSGISLYNKTYSILDENYIAGFSGFIQAITILGKQYTKDGIKVLDIESSADDIDEKEKEIKELDFNFFHSLICDYGDLRVVLLLTEHSSIRLRKIIDLLTKEIYSQNKDLISSFNGNLHPIRSSVEEILNRFLPLYYKNPFELNKSEHYHSVKVSGTLTNLEIRILNVLESKSKYKKDYLLEEIISLIDDINEDEKIIAVESLIRQKMVKPI